MGIALERCDGATHLLSAQMYLTRVCDVFLFFFLISREHAGHALTLCQGKQMWLVK